MTLPKNIQESMRGAAFNEQFGSEGFEAKVARRREEDLKKSINKIFPARKTSKEKVKESAPKVPMRNNKMRRR